MKTAIIIPARYGSTRFPGKPLAKIAGKTMLQRVVEIGRKAISNFSPENNEVTLCVATEDKRIRKHCEEIGIDCVMTSDECHTGSDRVMEACGILQNRIKNGANGENGGKTGGFDFIIGLQGDAPFTPVEAIEKMIGEFAKNPDEIEVVTPVIPLRWKELEELREQKKTTPFSGTTAIIDKNGHAIWFSKNIIPAIRSEDRLSSESEFSPIYQHLGLYGYRTDILEKFVSLPQGHYEKLEGLEQLRLLENGISIKTIRLEVDAGLAQAGIDSPEDIERAEKLLYS